MPSVRDIKRRIRSIENTGQVTNAMALIAASKMARAQNAVQSSRPYEEKITNVVTALSAQVSGTESVHPLLEERDVNTIGLMVIGPDRGLCGGLISNLSRFASSFVSSNEQEIRSIAVGRKSRDVLVRCGLTPTESFSDLGDRVVKSDTESISKLLMDQYSSGEIDAIYLCYSKFISTTTQEPVIEKVIPIDSGDSENNSTLDYIYEPSTDMVLGGLIPRYVDMKVFHAIQESIASELSARMVAMRNATDNAKSLGDDLTVVMNKLRQDSITNELLDLVGGQAALE
jgi:F-type H+-transporting ATPase subunit gamma|tara:strand:- start:1758 stop:2615 length:858 start_codon:yes stop_codon:yes gene_type:complete